MILQRSSEPQSAKQSLISNWGIRTDLRHPEKQLTKTRYDVCVRSQCELWRELSPGAEVPLPDLIHGWIDHQFQQEGGNDSAHHWRSNMLHDVRSCSRGPHDGNQP